MNTDIVEGKWKQLKGQVQQKWGRLTDDDLSKMKGSYNELQGLLEERYGYEKDRSKKEIDDFIKEHDLD